jgi:hypothetical protein
MNHLNPHSLGTFAEQLDEVTTLQVTLPAFFEAVAAFVDAVWGLDSMEEVAR